MPGIVLLVFILGAVFSDVISPHPWDECFLRRSLQGPSATHWFGTDLQGCDQFTRLLLGARTSLVVAASVIAGGIAIGLGVGTLAAWRGGWVDAVLSRLTDVLFAIPVILTALLLFGITEERSLLQVVVVLTLFSWPPMARVVRTSTLDVLTREHIDAARVLGASPLRIIRLDIFPEVLGPLLTFALPYAGTIMALEAVLSFVGAGLQLPNVSWGLMLAGLGGQLGVGPRVARAPHLVAPAIALALLVWALIGVGARLHQRNASDLR